MLAGVNKHNTTQSFVYFVTVKEEPENTAEPNIQIRADRNIIPV